MDSTESRSFGERLRAYRLQFGLTQEQLAERAGLSRRGIADLERGSRSAPHKDTVDRLAAALTLTASQRDELAAAGRRPVRRRGVRPASALMDGVPIGGAGARHNLSAEPTSFVGREQELTQLDELLGSARLVTLVGPGGVGKTRLALEVAASLTHRYSDGAWLVELAPINEPNLLTQSVASVLGIEEHGGMDLTTSLVTWLRTRQLLLVLDNCEHLVRACAILASQLIHACPQLRLLATSREVLGIAGETVWRVDPLRLPKAGHSVMDALEWEAIRLFVNRASAAAPHFALTDQNTPAVVEVCERLDGVPLALELAAARLRSMSVQDLATRLDHRFALLTGGGRDVRSSHRTLRGLVDWSYDLLDDAERTLFQEVSVFNGGWTLDAIEALCIPGSGSIVDVLSQLVDKSLVQIDAQPDGTGRYRILETLRQYAADQLEQSGRTESIRQRHALYYADAIVHRWGQFWFSVETSSRLATLELDYDNFRTALRWLIDRGDTRPAERLAAALTMFWMRTGRITEGIAWLGEVRQLPHSSQMGRTWRLWLFLEVMLAQLEASAGNRAAAYNRLQSVLPSVRDYTDRHVVAFALALASGLTLHTLGDLDAAHALAVEGLRIAQNAGAGHVEAHLRQQLSIVLAEVGDCELAEQLMQEDVASPIMGARAIISLAYLRLSQSRYADAAELLQDLICRLEENRTRIEAVMALTALSWVRLAQGDLAHARTAAVQAVTIIRANLGRTTSFGHLPGPLEAITAIAVAARRPALALRVGGAAASLREMYAEPLLPSERGRLEHWLERARSTLGQQHASVHWEAGLSLSPEAAIDEALSMDAAALSDTS